MQLVYLIAGYFRKMSLHLSCFLHNTNCDLLRVHITLNPVLQSRHDRIACSIYPKGDCDDKVQRHQHCSLEVI